MPPESTVDENIHVRDVGRPCVLVTGVAGFIGSHVAEALLRQGHHVIGVDEMNEYYSTSQKEANLVLLHRVAQEHNAEFHFSKSNVTNEAVMKKLFESNQIDKVCHLAARAGVRPSLDDPALYVRSNIEGMVTLLNLARLHKVSNFVYASSSSVYGGNTKIPFCENDNVDNPISPYAASKRSCELMATTFSTLYQLPCSGLRFFTVYGPRGRPDMAPFKFVDRIAKGLQIDRYGDGSSERDYTYIDDIVAGVLAALERPSRYHQIFNLGNSQTVSLKRFIEIIEATVGKKAIVRVLPEQPGDVRVTYADITKSKAMLDYCPKVSIEEGMRRVVDWYTSVHSAPSSSSSSSSS